MAGRRGHVKGRVVASLTRRKCREVTGVPKVVQSHPVPSEDEPPFDDIAEHWFENAETTEAAIDSTEWAAAIEDGERYADFAQSQSLTVRGLELFQATSV